MILKTLQDVTPKETSSNLELVLKETKVVLQFSKDWKFENKIINPEGQLNVIAIVGPTPKGDSVIFEVAMGRVTPYNRTKKNKTLP